MILTETFCDENIPDCFYSVPGYHVYRKDRIGKTDGGLLVYIKESLQAKRRVDLEENDLEENEMCPYKSKRPLFVGVIYRPPSTVANNKKL